MAMFIAIRRGRRLWSPASDRGKSSFLLDLFLPWWNFNNKLYFATNNSKFHHHFFPTSSAPHFILPDLHPDFDALYFIRVGRRVRRLFRVRRFLRVRDIP